MESIKIRVNIDIQSQYSFIDEVVFYNNYEGGFNHAFIGTEVSKLINSTDNIFAEEYFLVLGKDSIPDLIVYLDNNETDIWDFNQLESNRITKFRFYIPKNRWQ